MLYFFTDFCEFIVLCRWVILVTTTLSKMVLLISSSSSIQVLRFLIKNFEMDFDYDLQAGDLSDLVLDFLSSLLVRVKGVDGFLVGDFLFGLLGTIIFLFL